MNSSAKTCPCGRRWVIWTRVAVGRKVPSVLLCVACDVVEMNGAESRGAPGFVRA